MKKLPKAKDAGKKGITAGDNTTVSRGKLDFLCKKFLGTGLLSVSRLASETNLVFNLTAANRKRAIIKIFPPGKKAKLCAEEKASRIAKENGLPVAELFCVDATGKKIGLPFILRKKISGKKISTFLKHAKTRSRLYGQMGELLAKIHSIKLPKGYRTGTVKDFRKHVMRKFYEDLDALQKKRLLTKEEAENVRLRFDPALIKNPPEQSLLHGDYFAGQLLSDGKKITIIMDFEDSFRGAPEYDISYAHLMQKLENSGALKHFFKGYKKIKQLPKGYKKSCKTYWLFHLAEACINRPRLMLGNRRNTPPVNILKKADFSCT